MAKRTKFKQSETTAEAVQDATAITTTPDDTGVSSGKFAPLTNNNTNTNNDVATPISNVIAEDDQFTLLKYNIVNSNDYAKFIELAKEYNLFNNIDLTNLHKLDLICLIGLIINALYTKNNELITLNREIQAKRNSSFSDTDANNYKDLMGTLGVYKSWN
jgi:hypothetical protein